MRYILLLLDEIFTGPSMRFIEKDHGNLSA